MGNDSMTVRSMPEFFLPILPPATCEFLGGSLFSGLQCLTQRRRRNVRKKRVVNTATMATTLGLNGEPPSTP